MNWNLNNLLLLLASLLLLNGCAALRQPVTTTPVTWSQQQRQLEQIQAWQLTTRTGVHLPNNRNLLTSLDWTQQPQQYQITVYSPLNLGSIKITGNKNRVTLWKSSTQSFSAATPEQLMQSQLGWQLPISNMYYWIRSLPVPGVASEKQFEATGHLVVLQQQGWTIHYRSFTTVQQLELPSHIELTDGSTRIRIIVKNWQLQ
jgi:outer membrane lipoprotein LolB